jgi:hypothetical protein
MKILCVVAELFRVEGWTEGRTDRHDETKSFSEFCERGLKL